MIDTEMAESIVIGSSQDEVCGVLWDILKVADEEAIKAIKNGDSVKAVDLIFLVSRAGVSYRYHAEHPRISLVPNPTRHF